MIVRRTQQPLATLSALRCSILLSTWTCFTVTACRYAMQHGRHFVQKIKWNDEQTNSRTAEGAHQPVRFKLDCSPKTYQCYTCITSLVAFAAVWMKTNISNHFIGVLLVISQCALVAMPSSWIAFFAGTEGVAV